MELCFRRLVTPGDDRYRLWLACGTHDCHSLPFTTDRAHYCRGCAALWDEDGATLNDPQGAGAVTIASTGLD